MPSVPDPDGGRTVYAESVMFKSGDLVRHKSKPEWGIGRVTGQTVEGKVLVKFSARAGDVLLTAAGAEQHLVVETGADWQSAPTALRRAAPSAASRARRAPWTSARPCPRRRHLARVSAVLGAERQAARAAPVSGRLRGCRQRPSGPAASPDPAADSDRRRAGLCLNCRTNGKIAVGGTRVCAEFAK